MKVNKAQAIIYIFHLFLKNKIVKREDVQSVLSISDLTFRRYIQEIRAYLVNFNEQLEIKYLKENDQYILVEECK